MGIERACIAMFGQYLKNQMMRLSGIQSKPTYHKAISELVLALTEKFLFIPVCRVSLKYPDEIALFKALADTRYDTHPVETSSIPMKKLKY